MAVGLDTTLPLNDGRAIPQLGLGVWQATPAECRRAVRHAIEHGYRHVDTAKIYANERDVGEAIRDSSVPRSEVFVTTKLWNSDQGYESAKKALRDSLKRLGTDYVDLYLLHWPVPRLRLDSWRALVELQRDGLARSIGVSNFMVHHLDELAARSDVVPAVNQVELSPYLQVRDLRAHCAAKGIVVEAYSPLTRGLKLRDPRLVAVAKRVGRTPAQVLVRWCVEKGLVVLPKSTNPERIDENGDVFSWSLDEDAMAALDALEEGLHTGWDPTRAP